MLNDRGQFIGGIPDTLIVGQRNAVVLATVFEPLLVGPIWRKQVEMPLYFQPGRHKNCRKTLA